MPLFPDQAETANNRDAEAGLSRAMSRRSGAGNANGEQITGEGGGEMAGSDASWLVMTRQMKAAAEQQLNALRNIWANNYRAINNQHVNGSKYVSQAWRGRSQLHRPKTRTALKKADAGAANALFATSDVVNVEPVNALDEQAAASAAINKALLNYRLDRKSGRAGIPWFQIAVGAHNDSKATGICVSKQYWERREKETGETETVEAVDPLTGLPMTFERPRRKVIRDRPMCRLFPPELVLRDPGADWLDQAQDSTFIGLMHPMTIGDWKAMAADMQVKTRGHRFRSVDDSVLQAARIGATGQQANTARESAGQQGREQISVGVTEFDRFWAIEWFVRFQGEEWTYWTAGAQHLLTDVALTEDVYPEQGGDRPVVVGVGNIEPHKIDPMSMVQSILPLQMEINELANMRLDGVKESIRPLTMVRRGKKIDVKAIQQRSGDTAVYVDEKDDVTFDRPGALGGEAYMEMNHLNADFDDAVGQFNGASVSTNRALNETVGGMRLLNSSANVVGDFDLRVWIETWTEPVLRQLVRLEQYYEDDKVVLAVAGQKAKLYQKFNISEVSSELLDRELFVSVNAGIGNADPMVKLDKFIKVAASLGTLLGPAVQERAKQDAIIDELFGAAGFRDAAERFFHEGGQDDPRLAKMQQIIAQLEQQVAEKQSGLENALQIKRIDSATQLVKTFLDGAQKRETAEHQAVQSAKALGMQHAFDQRNRDAAGAGKDKAAPKPKAAEAAPPPAETAQDAKADQVEARLGDFSQEYIMRMLPMLMGQDAPVQPQPQPAPPPMPAPPPPQQPDPMMGQVLEAMMLMAQQQAQGMQAMAQSIQQLAAAQSAPKTVRRNDDGSMTLVPQPQQQMVTGYD